MEKESKKLKDRDLRISLWEITEYVSRDYDKI